MTNLGKRTPLLAAAAISVLGVGSPALAGGKSAPPTVVFADFSASSNKTNLTWSNDIIPAVYKIIPAVTKTTSAVTQTIPAVYKTIPAVTKIVNGKVVVVTPAKSVLVTPAKTIIITPAKTVIVTPAQKVLVTPAHDGPSGSLFSTTAAKASSYGLAQVNFAFKIYPLAKLGEIPAQFSFQATSPAVDPAQTVGALLAQSGLSGTFAFTYDGAKPLKVWATTYNPGANLLSGNLQNFLFDGAKGGRSGAVLATPAFGSVVTYQSDFLDFSKTLDRELSFYFLANSKFKADAGAALHTISGNVGGSFSSTRPRPTAVPEGPVWLLMLVGFGGLGAALRARRRKGVAA